MLKRLANESVLLLALVAAVCVALDLPETWINVVLAAVPLLLALVVRQITTSPATLVNVATSAATRTAQHLTDATAGTAGEVTDTAERVVDRAVRGVVSGVGGLVGTVAGVTRGPAQEPPL